MLLNSFVFSDLPPNFIIQLFGSGSTSFLGKSLLKLPHKPVFFVYGSPYQWGWKYQGFPSCGRSFCSLPTGFSKAQNCRSGYQDIISSVLSINARLFSVLPSTSLAFQYYAPEPAKSVQGGAASIPVTYFGKSACVSSRISIPHLMST